ncbi:5'-AMP-activated protein kinase beta subunit, interation domain-containing protein [Xylaria bambusicola]|uniref:5'-AMP-activated protein kinase beta subunit, interation domain-containing protein n=1 Tax=Xylaria bambusicola TaxID=326684 RepID=UPI002008BA11|nr:5'-AMP-activated protein kinase beta subunit, interation domain-containing protein [Xylaria bambusicola]KAI0503357.1 5'-AMP-activated protein kinase beta subunit, interation domain-containing protein [Xylaria bambusicola]
MGNTPSSTSKPATPTPSASSNASADSPRASKKEHKNLVSIHHPHQIRSPASLEASVVQAQGSTIPNRSSQLKPLSLLNQASPTSSQSDKPVADPRTQEEKPRYASDVKQEELAPSKPVAVPQSHIDTSPFAPGSHLEEGLPTGTTSSSIQDMAYPMPRPPRLPLPIEEEIHTPGSPIASPEDINNHDVDDVAPLDEQAGIPRRTSGLSNVTDEDDAEELRVDKSRPTLPTRITWLRGGQKVYVTGTPFQWSRKQRLVPAQEEGVLETTIRVFPGTHHIKFLVDGTMQTSPDLPTTVDFGNNLVNYIEVSGDTPAVRELNIGKGVFKDEDAHNLPSRQPSATPLPGAEKGKPKTRHIVPADQFSGKLPQYLEDFDQPEESKAYRASAAAMEKLPGPPTLPGFLSKPIMNNTTLIKDDNSVLNMPNHTVLNHLATCSIRNNVLALSATTRYKDKYVTTIIYKPTKN